MRTYLREELERFLEAVDAALTQSAEIVVIGGTAAVLRHGVTLATHDIDTMNAIREDLAEAAKRAREVTGLPVPLRQSGVADAPYDYESRLLPVMSQLKRLKLAVPEKHDLALMKTMRADEHDIDAIAEMHAHSPLDLEILVQRFRSEMHAAIGEPRRLRGNFLAVAERLFPDAVARVERSLRA